MAGNNPLNYGPDIGVEHFTVTADARLLNRIDEAGPAPNAVYGPGSWIKVIGGGLLDSKGAAVTGNYAIDASIGTRGVNQNLPGLIAGKLDVLPFQVTVTNTNVTDVDVSFSSLYIDFILENPAACKLNPFSIVSALAAEPYGATENIEVGVTPATPVSALSPFPYSTSQDQPYVSALSASDLSTYASKSTINIPLSKIGAWRLTIPNQNVGTTVAVITVHPDYKNYLPTPVTNPPFIVNVNLRGSYTPFSGAF